MSGQLDKMTRVYLKIKAKRSELAGAARPYKEGATRPLQRA